MRIYSAKKPKLVFSVCVAFVSLSLYLSRSKTTCSQIGLVEKYPKPRLRKRSGKKIGPEELEEEIGGSGFGDWNCLWVSWLRLVELEKRNYGCLDWRNGFHGGGSRNGGPPTGLGGVTDIRFDWVSGRGSSDGFQAYVRTSFDHLVEKVAENCETVIW